MTSSSSTASRWIPLESNPEVLNNWSRKVGLLPGKEEFVDILGLDDELLAFVPKPVKAVILLFPITENLEKAKRADDEKIVYCNLPAVNHTVIWIKQTISNACGTIGLLHALLNTDAAFQAGSALEIFREECKVKTSDERSVLLETTSLFATVHEEQARTGQSAVVQDTEYHFTCFVQVPKPGAVGTEEMRLIELDGRRKGPVDRGACSDLLQDTTKYIKDNLLAEVGNTLSMMALCGPSTSV